MATVDTNTVVRQFLVDSAILGTKIYCPRLPENVALPAISFFTRGGRATPYIPPMPEPSVQFDCWAYDPLEARRIYGLLYDALQGIQREVVTVSGTDYIIWGAEEEVQGQDLVDTAIQGYFRVLTFFRFIIKAE